MTKSRAIKLSVLAVLLALSAAMAQTEMFAGYVVSYQSHADAYRILHGGHSAETGYYAKVFAGDVITLSNPNETVRLRFTDGSSATVTASSAPYTVRAPSRPGQAPVHNLLVEVGRFLTRKQEDEFSALGRAGPEALGLSIPGLSDGTALVAAGRRVFGVAWDGGLAPFTVILRDASNQEVVHEDDLPTRELIKQSRPVELVPGTYTLLVRDHSGAEAGAKFTVVAPGSIPSPEPGLIPDFLQPNERATMRSSWILLDQPKTYWFEAYLEALPYSVGSQPDNTARLIDWTIRNPGPPN